MESQNFLGVSSSLDGRFGCRLPGTTAQTMDSNLIGNGSMSRLESNIKKAILKILVLIWLPIAGLTADQEVVEIGVAGLACPFCVYSLEKNLIKLANIESVEVNLATGSARIVMVRAHKANVEAIRLAIVNAGFTPGEATTTLTGQ